MGTLTKMKFNTLAYLFITLIISASLCEAKRKHSILIKPINYVPQPLPSIQMGGEVGEVCSRPIRGFIPVLCKKGLVCQPRPEDLAKHLKGVSSYCQLPTINIKPLPLPIKINIATEGNVCHKAVPNFPKTECVGGTECRPRPGQEGLKGGSWICQKRMKIGKDTLPPRPLPAIRIAKPGKICHRAVPNFPKTLCTEGFECKPRPGRENFSGGSFICQPKMKIGGDTLPPRPLPAVRIARAGEVCHKAIPNFPKTVCENGFSCKPRSGEESLSGVSFICQKNKYATGLIKHKKVYDPLI